MGESQSRRLTSYSGDSPAEVNPSQSPENKMAKMTTDTSGRSFHGWSESSTHLGLLLRTSLASCELPLTTFVRTWSIRATKSGFTILKLRLSERRTDESASSLWRTPTAHDYRTARSQENFEQRRQKGLPVNLNDQARYEPPTSNGSGQQAKLLPTPTASMHKDYGQAANLNRSSLTWAAKLLPTPVAHDHKSNASPADFKRHSPTLAVAAGGGALNPEWGEWLMGFPSGWTDIGT